MANRYSGVPGDTPVSFRPADSGPFSVNFQGHRHLTPLHQEMAGSILNFTHLGDYFSEVVIYCSWLFVGRNREIQFVLTLITSFEMLSSRS